jgi:hypothetical protein
MIKELSEKFGTMTVDFKVILKDKEVIVFMMPIIENGKDIAPLKFKGSPETIDEQIRTSILEMGNDVAKSVSDYDSFLKSVDKAKLEKAKPKAAKVAAKPVEKTQPSLF